MVGDEISYYINYDALKDPKLSEYNTEDPIDVNIEKARQVKELYGKIPNPYNVAIPSNVAFVLHAANNWFNPDYINQIKNYKIKQEQADQQRRAQDFQYQEALRLRDQDIENSKRREGDYQRKVEDYQRNVRFQDAAQQRITEQFNESRLNNEAQRAMQRYAMDLQNRQQALAEERQRQTFQQEQLKLQQQAHFQDEISKFAENSLQIEQETQKFAQQQYQAAQQFQQQFLTQEMTAVSNMEKMIKEIIDDTSLNPLLANQREASKQLLNLQQNPQGYLNDPSFKAMQESLTRKQAQQGSLGGGLAASQDAQLFMQALPTYQQQLAAIASPNQGNIDTANLLTQGLYNTIGAMGSIGQQFASNLLPVNASSLTSSATNSLSPILSLLKQSANIWG